MAMPLAQVDRLEEFRVADFESTGDGPVVQYRGGILPLVGLSEWAGGTLTADADGMTQAVVVGVGGRSVGLLVDRILDIVKTTAAVHPAGARPGIAGTAVVDGRVAELLDVQGVLADALPDRPGVAAGVVGQMRAA